MFKRDIYQIIKKRLKEPRKFIQILSGPRQSGKTTLVRQVMDDLDVPALYVAADSDAAPGGIWIEQQWEAARLKARSAPGGVCVLILDEVQKVPGWSGVVKGLWDADGMSGVNVRVVLLGSSPLLVQQGLTESLAGRFELIRITHWSFAEMQAAFGFSADQYIFFGGYPGPAGIVGDGPRWKQYILDSLVETSISRDILMMSRIDKPTLLKRLFEIGCLYSGQILSFNKILGQLHDAGNTTTLSHYLVLLGGAGLLTGLQKFSTGEIAARSSSPKFQVLNNALLSSQMKLDFDAARSVPESWGRLVESSVGAHLVNATAGSDITVHYWRDSNREVDFVLKKGDESVGIEVKSGRAKAAPGLDRFAARFSPRRVLLAGAGGIPVDEFFSIRPEDFFR